MATVSPPLTAPNLPLAEGLSRDFLLHHGLCPRAYDEDGALVVAVAPDAFRAGLDDIAVAYRARVTPSEATRQEVELLVERLTSRAERPIELARSDADDADAPADVRDLVAQRPVVRYVNSLVRDAYDAGASDIHLEATRGGLTARFRLDGVLAVAPEPPAQLHHAVVSRIKLLAELDIAERRRPQDGRIRVRLESRELDLRVSTVPTLFGESVVLRLLERGGRPVALEELGMSDAVLGGVLRLALRPHGLVLVTGPTGSGKTTTMYAALQQRDATAEKIVTVEDPVEYQLAGVTQVPVHRQAGMGFGSALRSILRQDPDVVMIGEMRDAETAEIAVQAAMTGHLVLSTLHTNHALGAVARLFDLGIAPYLASATLEGVVAQRLVRRLCTDCSVEYEPRAEQVALLSERPVGRAKLLRSLGCAACRGTGFRGRIGLFELLPVTEEVKDAVLRPAPRARLRELALAAGMIPLRLDGWRKVEAGLTTVEEVLRVVQD